MKRVVYVVEVDGEPRLADVKLERAESWARVWSDSATMPVVVRYVPAAKKRGKK